MESTASDPGSIALPHHWILVTTIFLIWLINLITIRYRKGLSQIPGPFLASISSLDRLLKAFQSRQYRTDAEYHKKYGPIVRVGPNHVSIADPDCIQQIYGIHTKFRKSNYYAAFDVETGKAKVPTTFSIRDEEQHKAIRRPVANAFSMGSMVELEPMADECSRIFTRKMDEKLGTDIDLGTWLHWYAFDFITSVTFSNRLGFMETESDIEGVIEAIEGRLAYNAVVGMVPTLHNYLFGNETVKQILTIFPSVAKLATARRVAIFAAEQLKHRNELPKSSSAPRDMLDRFKISKDGEVLISDGQVLAHAASNIFAGSDTTAIALRAMIYYLCKNQQCYKKLLDEIDELDAKGELSDPITFGESQHMPYLQACMKEAMRMHPSCGQMLERVVPEEGAILLGTHFSEGTIVGINPWVVGKDKATYGDDADIYRPERWLEAEAAKHAVMEKNFFSFGAGARSCIGRNVSILEMSKLVPQILRCYHVELTNPDKEWECTGYFFVKQYGLNCRLTKRSRTSEIKARD